MPDGSHAALLSMPEACESSLTNALERLLACAEQGLRPEGVLRDIHILLSERGLLLTTDRDRAGQRTGTTDQVAEPAQHSAGPVPPSHAVSGTA